MSQEVCLISTCDIFREGIGKILTAEGFKVSGSVEHPRSLGAVAGSDNLIFLIDDTDTERSPHMVEELIQTYPSAIIITLAAEFDLHNMLDCFKAGAAGYIIKSRKAAPIIAAVKLAASGEKVLPPDILSVFDKHTRPMPSLPELSEEVEDPNLSPREHDVLCCLMAGYSNKVIARELEVCEATVKVHVKAILRKLNVHNRTQAAIWGSSHSAEVGAVPWRQSSRYCPTSHVS